MLYGSLRVFLGLLFKLFFKWQVKGVHNVPETGGAIIAANHISLWDPPVIGTALTRHVRFMAKEELFVNPVFNLIITNLGAFPVKRGAADRTAIRTALSTLEGGGVLGLFPEGTRSKTGTLGQPEAGLALLAVKSGAPVVPTAIIGTNQVLCNGHFLPRFKVIFGKPMYLTKKAGGKESMEELSGKVMAEIARLLEEGK